MGGTFEAPLWSQVELLRHGYSQVVCRFTVHLDSTTDRVEIGASLRDLMTSEPIAIEAFPFQGSLLRTDDAAAWMAQVLSEARARLTPFP